MFKKAIVRIPGENFADGLTTANLGKPDYQLVLAQHRRYCDILRSCGLELIVLPPDWRYPDSTFVEDTAVLTDRIAVITRPGAASRLGEEKSIYEVLIRHYEPGCISRIQPPGTVDGGDICEADGHFFIGLSARTNLEGGKQLAAILQQAGYSSEFVDVTKIPGILHLKSGMAYLGDQVFVLMDAMTDMDIFRSYSIIRVEKKEQYAANCIRVNDTVIIAEGFPVLEKALSQAGFKISLCPMSEFQKMDGGLSCLSLRF